MSLLATMTISLAKLKIEKLISLFIISITKDTNISKYNDKHTNMLLTPQHRRSSRIESKMQKEAQRVFNEKIANGTMSKEELLNTPKCLRNFDEAEDAILEKDDGEDGYNTYLYRQEQEKKRLRESSNNTRKALLKMEKTVIERRIGLMEAEAVMELSDERKRELHQEAQELKCRLMKLEYQKLIYALELVECEITKMINGTDDEEDEPWYDEQDERELRTNKWDTIDSEWKKDTTPREYHEVINGYPYIPPSEQPEKEEEESIAARVVRRHRLLEWVARKNRLLARR